MFGSVGGPEIILIFMVALLVFGPKKLPEIGRKLGGVVRDLRRATGEFRYNLEREIGFDPASGMEEAKKARREMFSSVSDPIREAAQGTIGAVRQLSAEAAVSIDEVDPDRPRKNKALPAPEGGEGKE